MSPLSPVEWTYLVITLMGLATLLYLAPSCDEPGCTNAHTAHRVTARSASLEKEHATFHGADRPKPTCVLCQARKRDES